MARLKELKDRRLACELHATIDHALIEAFQDLIDEPTATQRAENPKALGPTERSGRFKAYQLHLRLAGWLPFVIRARYDRVLEAHARSVTRDFVESSKTTKTLRLRIFFDVLKDYFSTETQKFLDLAARSAGDGSLAESLPELRSHWQKLLEHADDAERHVLWASHFLFEDDKSQNGSAWHISESFVKAGIPLQAITNALHQTVERISAEVRAGQDASPTQAIK